LLSKFPLFSWSRDIFDKVFLVKVICCYYQSFPRNYHRNGWKSMFTRIKMAPTAERLCVHFMVFSFLIFLTFLISTLVWSVMCFCL
jgi:hypothetical protein